jgi:O-antigen/teichoic acid export membrane protein
MRVWTWLNSGLGGGVTIGALFLALASIQDADWGWAILCFSVALAFGGLPPIGLGLPAKEVKTNAWQLLCSIGAGAIVGIIGWQAGLGFGGLALLAVVLTLVAGYGVGQLKKPAG